MCLVLYPQNLEDEVVAVLDALGVPGYTETQKVIGRGPRGHHFDTQVWPGADGMIFTVVNSDQAEAVASTLANLSRELEQRSQGLFGLPLSTTFSIPFTCFQRCHRHVDSSHQNAPRAIAARHPPG